MKTSLIRLFLSFMAVMIIAGCKEKKEPKTIITTRPVEVVKNDTVNMEEVNSSKQVEWHGSVYNISINRHPDRSLAITEDEDETKYYDNRIVLNITHKDGSLFLKRDFLKTDFRDLVSEEFFAKKALVGFVFDKVDGGNLRFAASIGSPDKFSDDFIPFDVVVTASGNVSVKLSEQTLVDTSEQEEI